MIDLDYNVLTVAGSAEHVAMRMAPENSPMRMYYYAKMDENR